MRFLQIARHRVEGPADAQFRLPPWLHLLWEGLRPTTAFHAPKFTESRILRFMKHVEHVL